MQEVDPRNHSDCGHKMSWLLPHQYNTVEDLQDQESEIVETVTNMDACFTARTISDVKNHLPELQKQLLRFLYAHSPSINILTNKLGEHHPLVTKHKLEDTVKDRFEMTRLVREDSLGHLDMASTSLAHLSLLTL